jgi:hypothetical protein
MRLQPLTFARSADYIVELLEEKEIELQEGVYHNGKGSVVRFVGRKK